MFSELRCAYYHGFRTGKVHASRFIGKPNSSGETYLRAIPTPQWLPYRLHRFVWRQGLREGAGVPTFTSQLITLTITGE
jgi:hypothetical protein